LKAYLSTPHKVPKDSIIQFKIPCVREALFNQYRQELDLSGKDFPLHVEFPMKRNFSSPFSEIVLDAKIPHKKFERGSSSPTFEI
jgi:hypothetical protein